MKIGILGGSFNPIHNGHLNLCNQCNELFNFDEILLIPTNIPPHKSNNNFISNSHRINMINLAIQGNDLIKSSEIEFELGGVSFTHNTVIALKKTYPPNAEFYFIIGSDMFKIFDKWYKYKELLKMIKIVVGARKNEEYNELTKIKSEKYSDDENIIVMNIDVYEMSSTSIREKIKSNKSIDGLLPINVTKYIQQNNLYV